MPKGRCAEQGYADVPLECRQALGMVAAEARRHVAGQQSAGHIPWVGAHSEENRMHRNSFQVGRPKKLAGTGDPLHALQERGGLADPGSWMTVTTCVTQRCLAAFDADNATIREFQNEKSNTC